MARRRATTSTDGPIELYAAGSLEAALGELRTAFRDRYAVAVQPTWGPSGLLRARIEAGERPHLFASADLDHPRALAAAGLAGSVVAFARNRLCALTRSGIPAAAADDPLAFLLDPAVRLASSTPGADPSGDYARQLFRRAEALRPGSFARLTNKTRQLTGAPDSPVPPGGRNRYAWALTSDRADVFLTYRTNALLAQRDTPRLEVMELPTELAVGADYGLALLTPERSDAARFADFLLSEAGQAILAAYGFDTPAPGATN